MAGAITRAGILFRKLLSGKPVTYTQLQREAAITRRTALRWIGEAKDIFGDLLQESRLPETGEKKFWLDSRVQWVRGLQRQPPTGDEMAAVDVALRLFQKYGMRSHHDQLTGLRGRLHGALERLERAHRTDTDAEAITDSLGIASRPGPHIPVPDRVSGPLREAVLKQRKVAFHYRTHAGHSSEKKASPAGLLYGGAVRLIAMEEGVDALAQFRLDRMSEVEILDEPHRLEEDALRNYLRTLFGSFGEKPVQVRWRFHPDAPEPEKWRFHPTQKIQREADGSTVVSFRAGGMDDMARHVIGWWDWIEVLAPKRLRRTVLKMKLAGLAPLLEEFADRRTAGRIHNLAREFGANKVAAGE